MTTNSDRNTPFPHMSTVARVDKAKEEILKDNIAMMEDELEILKDMQKALVAAGARCPSKIELRKYSIAQYIAMLLQNK